MSFATDVQKSSFQRFLLVRIKPRKHLDAGTLHTGSTYKFSYTYTEYGTVYVNGVAVADINVVLDAGFLYVTSLTDLSLSTNIVTVEIPIYITGGTAVDTYGNTSGLPEKIWEPYLVSFPSWSQSIRNIGDAVFSIDNTTLNVVSENRWIQNLVGARFSWNRADVDVWLCIDSVNSSKKIFNGEVISLTISNNLATINVADAFNRLNKKAEFGSGTQAYYQNVQPEDNGKAKPLVIGVTSPSIIAPGYRISEAYGTPASTNFYHLSDGIDCVPTSSNLDTSTSVTFSCGRIIGDSLKKLNFGSISRAYEHYMVKTIYADNVSMDVGVRLLYLQCSSTNTLRIGDYVPSQGNICSIGSFTHAGNSYNVAIVKTDYFFDGATIYSSGAISVPSISNDTHPSISVWIDGTEPASYEVSNVALGLVPTWAIPSYSGRPVPFTVSYGTSYDPGIGTNITEVFVTISSSNISDSSKPELPGKKRFKCRFSPNDPLTHAETIAALCLYSQMDINTSTFITADSDLDSSVVMTIPPFKQTEFPTCLQVAQSVIKSTFGYLKVNSDRLVEYNIIKDPDSLTIAGTRDDSSILINSCTANVEYQDAVYQIVFENPEYKDREALDTNGPYVISTVNSVKYLHKTDKTLNFTHVLSNIYGIKDRIFYYLSNPTVEYTYETSALDLDSEIGDIISIQSDSIAEESTTINAMIVGIQSTTGKTTIRTNELRGVD